MNHNTVVSADVRHIHPGMIIGPGNKCGKFGISFPLLKIIIPVSMAILAIACKVDSAGVSYKAPGNDHPDSAGKSGVHGNDPCTVEGFRISISDGMNVRSNGTKKCEMVIDTFNECSKPPNVLPCEWRASRNDIEMYSMVNDSGNWFVRIKSRRDATSIAKRSKYSPHTYPWLHWRWRVHTLPEGGSENRRETGDSGAGVYVIFEGKLWNNPVIKYVWSATLPKGTVTESPYNRRTRIVVLRQGMSEAECWQSERVDVEADYRRLFDIPPPSIEAIGIITDSDNTRSSAWADYDDLCADSGQ